MQTERTVSPSGTSVDARPRGLISHKPGLGGGPTGFAGRDLDRPFVDLDQRGSGKRFCCEGAVMRRAIAGIGEGLEPGACDAQLGRLDGLSELFAANQTQAEAVDLVYHGLIKLADFRSEEHTSELQSPK